MADSPVLHLHNSLRQAKERWAIFLGAGSSYDYGIPTMVEIANILRQIIKEDKPAHGISKPTLHLLRELCPESDGAADWNIEDLLTRLYQLLDATASPHAGFAAVATTVGETSVDSEAIRKAADELTRFMAKMCDLASLKHTSHGTGRVDYLADFFVAMATFGSSTNRLIRAFTTNVDLCVEAAMVRLSQRARSDRRPDIVLVDGFDSSILPTFNMGCYTRPSAALNRCALYYWKLHGSVDWTYAQPLNTPEGGADEGLSDQSIIVRRIDSKLWGDLAGCGALQARAAEDQPIVIFPTPAKYSQTYTFPYMDMFEAFRRTLEEVELLICVGTSFPDQHIRSAVRSFVERDNTLLFVVDPQVTDENLRTFFGQSRSVQPVIGMGFEEFVKEFTTLEAVTSGASGTGKKA